MADIRIESTVTEWQSLNTLTGISSGVALLIQNKGSYPFIIQTTSSQPDDDDTDGSLVGEKLNVLSIVSIDTDEDEVWIRPVYYGESLFLNVQQDA